MRHFKFTMILGGTNILSGQLVDRLYEIGCNDALIHYTKGVISLDFNREGERLGPILEQLIADIEDIILTDGTEIYVSGINMIHQEKKYSD